MSLTGFATCPTRPRASLNAPRCASSRSFAIHSAHEIFLFRRLRCGRQRRVVTYRKRNHQNRETMIDPLYVASGFGVGLLVGMNGVGGGSLMTPLLILLFGVHLSTAVGTDLLYAAATKTGGSLVHGW